MPVAVVRTPSRPLGPGYRRTSRDLNQRSRVARTPIPGDSDAAGPTYRTYPSESKPLNRPSCPRAGSAASRNAVTPTAMSARARTQTCLADMRHHPSITHLPCASSRTLSSEGGLTQTHSAARGAYDGPSRSNPISRWPSARRVIVAEAMRPLLPLMRTRSFEMAAPIPMASASHHEPHRDGAGECHHDKKNCIGWVHY